MKRTSDVSTRALVMGDLKQRYHHSSPTKPGGWFHKGAEHYPQYVLRAE